MRRTRTAVSVSGSAGRLWSADDLKQSGGLREPRSTQHAPTPTPVSDPDRAIAGGPDLPSDGVGPHPDGRRRIAGGDAARDRRRSGRTVRPRGQLGEPVRQGVRDRLPDARSRRPGAALRLPAAAAGGGGAVGVIALMLLAACSSPKPSAAAPSSARTPAAASSSSSAVPSEAALRAVAKEEFDAYAAGQYGQAWDVWTAHGKGEITRADYEKLHAECKDLGAGVPLKIESMSITGTTASVRVSRLGFLAAYTFDWENGAWRFEPTAQGAADYALGVDALVAKMKREGSCA
jgi:hypothetical protein